MNTKLFCLVLTVVAPLVCVYPGVAFGDEGQPPRMVFLSAVAADSNQGWLGVQLVDVPAALAAHLPSAAGGEMVLNVARGSPAEKAGLQQHDVIAAVNGEGLTRDRGGLVKVIGGLAPGSEVTLKVLRGGQEVTAKATLSSRPTESDLDWVYEFTPEAITREIVKARGKILSKDEGGRWHLQDLGDLSEQENLPEEIRKALPDRGEVTTKVFVDDENRKSFHSVVVRGGQTLIIEQEEGGPIVVKRTDRDGKTTEATYADADALKAADAEAYEIYTQTAEGADVQVEINPGTENVLRWHGRGPGPGALFREEWRKQYQSAMEEARKATEEAQKSMDEARKHFRLRLHRGGPDHPFFKWFSDEDSETAGPGAPPPARSFRVNPDGQIEATVRKGDTEVIKVFRDEADLRQRDPALHEEYAKVTSDQE
ncbi:MAG: PDZ domain-containing protein [Planctomycetota bacterium]